MSLWYNESDEEIEAEMNNNGTIGNDGEDPYRILESGRKVYLDELDVITLLDPPAYLIPNDANTYDQAAYLWYLFAYVIFKILSFATCFQMSQTLLVPHVFVSNSPFNK